MSCEHSIEHKHTHIQSKSSFYSQGPIFSTSCMFANTISSPTTSCTLLPCAMIVSAPVSIIFFNITVTSHQ